MDQNTNFPPADDLKIRWKRIRQSLLENRMEACLISSGVNIYYLTGHIFGGYVYLTADDDPIYFFQRPAGWDHPQAVPIRKPEDIPALLKERGMKLPGNIGLEADQITYNEYIRLQAVFNPATATNVTPILRKVRMIKTPWEIQQFRISAKKHAEAYRHIPSYFRPGMTDIELQNEIEREMRSKGSIGLFRAFGNNMDIYMGSLLSGDNAETPSPFDFALGGGGLHPSLPIGANGSILRTGNAVMVDMAGNYTAYITDMTRTFSVGKLSEKAYRAHQVSIDMNNRLMNTAQPGTSCAEIYNWSLQMAEEAGLGDCFMGTRQQAKFVGHGVGIEINELPVMTSRSQDLLQPGMVFAFEPKFVLHETGAVGIENTYLVTENGLEKLTVFEEEIREL